MTGEQAVLAVIAALEALGIDYMLVGSMSSNFYGIPRSTQDADFVVELGNVTFDVLRDRLEPPLRFDRQTTFETVSMTVRHVLHVPDANFKVELFRLSDNEHDQQRFRRRVRAKLLDHDVWLPTAEDVVITKLDWAAGRSPTKDLDDVRNVIAVQADRLDWRYIYSWADRRGTRKLLDEIRGEIPPH